MRSNRPVLLALAVALLVAGPASHLAVAAPVASGPTGVSGVGSADAPRSGAAGAGLALVMNEQPNTTNYLGIADGDIERQGYAQPSLDVGATLDREVSDWKTEYSTRTFEAAYSAADAQAERVSRIRTELDRIEERIDDLDDRRQQALAAYNAGEISTQVFFGRLAAIDAGARGVESRLQRLRAVAGLSLTTDLDTRLSSLEPGLLPLRGPVTERVGEAIEGDRESFTLYAVTATDGLVVATADDPAFYRDAYLGSNRETVGQNQFSGDDRTGITSADRRARELYPWAYARATPSLDGFPETSVYRVTLNNPHGNLETYLDGRTTEAFRELQEKRLSSLPYRTSTVVDGPARLRVNRTHGTGPMEVAVLDNATGQPLNATVSVNGYRIGTTGSDGRLWTVTPQQGVRIDAETESGRLLEFDFVSRD
jgi:hypothetical protein